MSLLVSVATSVHSGQQGNSLTDPTNESFGIYLPGLSANEPVPCHYAGAFQQKRSLEGLSRPLVSLGVFIRDCQHGLVWSTQSPRQESIVYTAVGEHFRIRPDRPIRKLESVASARTAELLIGLLGGDFEQLNRQFELVGDSASSDSDPKALSRTLTLLPRSAALKQFIAKIVLISTKASFQVTLLTQTGASTVIDIVNIQTFTGPCSVVPKQQGKACDLLLKPTSKD